MREPIRQLIAVDGPGGKLQNHHLVTIPVCPLLLQLGLSLRSNHSGQPVGTTTQG